MERSTSVYIAGMLGITLFGCVPGSDGDRLTGGDGTTNLSADLTGGQETPPVTTTGVGTGTFVFDEDANTLSFEITATDFPGEVTVAHFHVGAAGVAGPVVFNLTDLLQVEGQEVTINGTTNLDDWDANNAADQLLDGNIYVNIHSAANPAGEIRGQLELTAE